MPEGRKDGADSTDTFASTVAAPQPAAKDAGFTQPSLLQMTECPRCHVATPVARFCTACGASLAARRFCSECGGHLKPDAPFCEACGTQVG